MTRYHEGISLAAIGRGNRRLLAPAKARATEAGGLHAERLAAWRERRTKAAEIKDAEQRAAALDAVGERPLHPMLVAAGCAVVGAIVLAGIPAIRHHIGVIATGTLTLWLLAALILGQKAADEEEVEKATETEAAQEPSPGALGSISPTVADARLAVALLGATGTHVALAAVTAHLAAQYPAWHRSPKEVRALLSQAGVRVRGGVRMEGVSVPGIHRDDVPALPLAPEGAPEGVVAAGQSNNNNTNNAEAAVHERGYRLAPHPDDPRRTTIEWAVEPVRQAS